MKPEEISCQDNLQTFLNKLADKFYENQKIDYEEVVDRMEKAAKNGLYKKEFGPIKAEALEKLRGEGIKVTRLSRETILLEWWYG